MEPSAPPPANSPCADPEGKNATVMESPPEELGGLLRTLIGEKVLDDVVLDAEDSVASCVVCNALFLRQTTRGRNTATCTSQHREITAATSVLLGWLGVAGGKGKRVRVGERIGVDVDVE